MSPELLCYVSYFILLLAKPGCSNKADICIDIIKRLTQIGDLETIDGGYTKGIWKLFWIIKFVK